MKTVYKYPIILDSPQVILLPKDAKILSIQHQGKRKDDNIFLWALVETENPLEERTLIIETSGENLDKFTGELDYITTIQLMNGGFVLHFFELKKG